MSSEFGEVAMFGEVAIFGKESEFGEVAFPGEKRSPQRWEREGPRVPRRQFLPMGGKAPYST